MHALLVLAVEDAAESSKTAFYVAGVALATWAVALAAIGLSRPEFPGSDGAARGVIAVSVVLVIAAAAAAVVTS